jgi:hypothetical protein
MKKEKTYNGIKSGKGMRAVKDVRWVSRTSGTTRRIRGRKRGRTSK